MKEQDRGNQWLANNIIGAIGGTSFFVILNAFLFNWMAWWAWMIIGFIWIGVISNIMRFYMVDRIHCPKCNQPATKYDKFCKFCGHKFLQKCPKCQASVDVGAKFCEECGTQLEEIKPPAEIEKPAEIKEPAVVQVSFCPGCGERIENPGAKHCSFCGTSLK